MRAYGVVDSSIGIGWVHRVQATALTDVLLGRVEGGEVFVVPAFWYIEMANVLLVLERRKKLTSQARREGLKRLGRLSLWVDDISPAISFVEASDVADTGGLTVYDALYLEAALRLGLPLATRDVELQKAAERAGVVLLK